MQLLVLSGRPAVGKLTVARELAALSGWRLFHNHLVVDALLAVFEFGSPPFVELREQIWRDVFAAASRAGTPGLIFTFSAENTVRQSFLDDLVAHARARGDPLHFIALICDESEIERRLDDASRHTGKKLTSLDLYHQLVRTGAFDRPTLPAPDFSIDTGHHAPAETARLIWDRLQHS